VKHFFHRDYHGLWLIISSILLGSAAQLLLKLGMNALPAEFDISTLPLDALAWTAGGLVCYALAMLLWMLALSRYELSFAYPLLSITYILVYLGAILLPALDETISLQKTLGILLIVAGVVFVTRSKSVATSSSATQ
jgi:undecaprenyl phosphate-alpha-L-ara4N flippase subunit ArnF